MHRLLRLSFLMVLIGFIAFSEAFAYKPIQQVSGSLDPAGVRVFVKDTIYVINHDLVIGGTLIIEPGTTVQFSANSRIIDSVGGRIIADGFANARYHSNPLVQAADNPYSSSDETLYPDYPQGKNNPFNYTDYSDLNYFLYNTAYLTSTDNNKQRVIDVMTKRDATVNQAKYNHIFNVVLDVANRTLKNLTDPTMTVWDAGTRLNYVKDPISGLANTNLVVIPFEQAMIFIAARMGADPNNDIDLRRFPWTRVLSNNQTSSVNIGTGDTTLDQIVFQGQPVNNVSWEWGHFIIMPGARGAFFRNCLFEHFKKDTTVDRTPLYNEELTDANWSYINNTLRLLTNGSGGVITTFSARTWLLNCDFTDNTARFKGGALQILQVPDIQAPNNFPMSTNGSGKYFDIYNLTNLPRYAVNKNPNITDKDGSFSSINKIKVKLDPFNNPLLDANGHPVLAAAGDPYIWLSTIPAIDNIDETTPEPTFNFAGNTANSSYYRQAFDDARLAMYLGRMRNLKFENNKVQLAHVGLKTIPGTPPITIRDDYTGLPGGDLYAIPAEYPREYGDVAYGGAIYIAGDQNDPNLRQIEVGLGINNSINLASTGTSVTFSGDDSFEAVGNKALNYQNQLQTADNRGSMGAKGGAIYLGNNTSLIVAGQFISNSVQAPWLQTETTSANRGFYACGGGIFEEKTRGRLQVRGGPTRDEYPNNNPTQFINNQAGTGGAIYVDNNLNNASNIMSPVIGGSDATIPTRDYGFNITFKDNVALSFGGAIFATRNFTIDGAGGIDPLAQAMIGYGGKFPVMFDNNSAGCEGGAISVRLPISSDLVEKDRAVEISRAVFNGNKVGYSIYDSVALKQEIRGGGAVYTINSSLSSVKGVQFSANMVKNGNGGALAMINPQSNTKRFFVTDLDVVNYTDGMASSFSSTNDVFTTSSVLAGDSTNKYPPDTRMLTQFLDNKIEWDPDFLKMESGSGTTQVGAGAVGTSENLKSVNFVNSQTGFVVGDNGMIIKLVDGGSQWVYIKGNTSKNLNKLTFLTQNVGFIVGKNSVILKTTDGGDSWNKVYEDNPVTDVNLFDVVFTTSDIGYAVGESGLILKTTDGGTTWNKIDAGVLNNLYGVDFTDLNYGYIVGERGIILRTTDAGTHWSTKVSGTLQDLVNVKFTSSQTGYVIGSNGVILKTYDGGNSWDAMNSATNDNLNAIVFPDQNTSYVVTDKGNVDKTSNGGESWTLSNSGGSRSLNGVFFLNKNFGYAVGDLGTILRTTNGGVDWESVEQANKSEIDAKRFHANGETTIPENGIGLGGAIYILDLASVDRAKTRQDSVEFNRVRLQNNESYTGAAIYSDNYDLKLIFNRSLVTGNTALSEIGMNQNAITGPLYLDPSISHTFNTASSDLAGAIIYGEIQGPLPSNMAPWAGNSIYDNNARFLIRLPDAPNSKGIFAGNTGEGFGGTDTLRGNYWGRTEANVTMQVPNLHIQSQTNMETFFVDADSVKPLDFIFWQSPTDRDALESSRGNLLFQGPFESISRYDYKPIPLINSGDENTPDPTSIPEKYLQSGRVYDLYDKGLDIKTADYSKRRMSPIEDFAVGIPPIIDRYTDDSTMPSFNKYIKRYVRDPFIADSVDAGENWVYPQLHGLQGEFMPAEDGSLYQPIGYPLFLEAKAKFESGLSERYNLDPRALEQTVFFVINETTGDFIRVNLKEMTTTSPFFRARVDLVPDSSDRYSNTNIRRTFEGLLNLGTDAPNGDPKLLKALMDNPYNEDRATLVGRKYENDNRYFGGTMSGRIEDLFINRSHWPSSNVKGQTSFATYFAGERYHSLPVDTGDVVRIVSRTVLWREGVNKALDDGIVLKITNSTEPPIYTGDVEATMNNVITKDELSQYPWGYVSGRRDTTQITEFRNTIFLTEDRMYPAPQKMYSDPKAAQLLFGTSKFNEYVQYYGDPEINTTVMNTARGRDGILTVTARDNNNYYDPRSLFVDTTYSNLYFDFKVDPNSGLRNWLFSEHIPAKFNVDNTKWGFTNPGPDSVAGFMIMRGRPTNPYVVPGGETLTLTVHNFPPHYRTIDSLMALDPTLRPGQDTIDKFMEIFSNYLNAPIYDKTNARYLQQDTIDLGKVYSREYQCKIYVVDSIPIFLDPDEVDQDGFKVWPRTFWVEKNLAGDRDSIGSYEPSVYPCRAKKDGRLLANLTNRLRFEADFNTNDEWEDKWADIKHWDFRYGRTAYGFKSIALRPNDDTTMIDPIHIDTTQFDGNTVLVQQRPIWMDSQFINAYDKDNQVDQFAADFTTWGKLNIRIDSALATHILTPQNQYNNALNLDTVFTVVANDGHGGINSITVPVMINVEPKILTTSLPPAKEDIDYNPELLDSSKMIKIFDPNFYQDHWYQLAYNDADLTAANRQDLMLPDSIDRDPCFSEAGKRYLRKYDAQGNLVLDLKTTPLWLKINKESGLLYGTPGVKDAPRTEQVTVLVWDEDSLSDIKTFSLRVDSVDHRPNISAAPEEVCVDQNKPYEDIINVVDKDLQRGRVAGDPTETLNVTVLQPSGLDVSYMDEQGNWVKSGIISGIRTSDSVKVKISTDNFNAPTESDGKVTIKIEVADSYGLRDTLVYRIKYSNPTDFVCDVTVANNNGDSKTLQFGTAPNATCGYGLDGDAVGQLDPQFCEYELPPLPDKDIFDVRWTIPQTLGVFRNIFKQGAVDLPGENRIYRAIVQSGGVPGNSSQYYPIKISWDATQIPTVDDATKNPSGGSWTIRDAYTSNGGLFRFDMNTGQGYSSGDVMYSKSGNIITLTIYSDVIDAFQILYKWNATTGVNDAVAGLTTQIGQVTPNPFSSMTNIQFSSNAKQNVQVQIVDRLGQVVKTLANDTYAPGTYNVPWDGKDNNNKECASGTYTCRMVAGTEIRTEPIVIVR